MEKCSCWACKANKKRKDWQGRITVAVLTIGVCGEIGLMLWTAWLMGRPTP